MHITDDVKPAVEADHGRRHPARNTAGPLRPPPSGALRRLAAALPLLAATPALVGGCDGPAWSPADSTLAAPVRVEDGPTFGSLADDRMREEPGGPVIDPAPAPAAAADAEPSVLFLWYADGGAIPVPYTLCPKTPPPKYVCGQGADDVCAKKAQKYLDKWYADFNLVFTYTKPTSGAFYTEVVLSDHKWCGFNSGGVAPFACGDMHGGACFAFDCGHKGDTDQEFCAYVIAQEHGHLVGLEHTTSPTDVMDGNGGPDARGFEDRENTVSSGGCRSTQNSYQLMKMRLGAWDTSRGAKPDPFAAACTDTADPTVAITEPADKASVPATVTVKAEATDDCGVKTARIEVSPAGLGADASGSGPFQWSVEGLSGRQTIKVTVTDGAGKSATTQIDVTAPGEGGGAGGNGSGGRGGSGSGGEGGGNGGTSGANGDGTAVTSGCSTGAHRAPAPSAALVLAGLLALLKGRHGERRGANTRRESS